MWRQSGRSRWNCVTQPFANLCADCTAMDAIDSNAVWLLVGHKGCRLELNLPDQLPEAALVHYGYREPQMICPGRVENGRLMHGLGPEQTSHRRRDAGAAEGVTNGRLRCTIAISAQREDV